MKEIADKKAVAVKYLQRRGWMDTSILNPAGEEFEPSAEELGRVVELFYVFHEDNEHLVITALGCRALADEKRFHIFYKPHGWEQDEKEFYDLIVSRGGEYRMCEARKFFREVGLNFSPDDETYQKIQVLSRLCIRYGHLLINRVPVDDREYFEWYLRIAGRRHPRIDENLYRNCPISGGLSFSVTRDLFRLAFLIYDDSYIEEEWERQRKLPPEACHDELFLEFYTKLGREEKVMMILNDLWQRGENWSLYRLVDRLKKGYVKGHRGLRRIPLIEARLLSLGERVMGAWNREELAHLMSLSDGDFPSLLFDIGDEKN